MASPSISEIIEQKCISFICKHPEQDFIKQSSLCSQLFKADWWLLGIFNTCLQDFPGHNHAHQLKWEKSGGEIEKGFVGQT